MCKVKMQKDPCEVIESVAEDRSEATRLLIEHWQVAANFVFATQNNIEKIKGLLLCQVVATDDSAKIIAEWESDAAYKASRKILEKQIRKVDEHASLIWTGVEREFHSSLTRKSWVRLRWGNVVALVAVIGILYALLDQFESLKTYVFEVPRVRPVLEGKPVFGIENQKIKHEVVFRNDTTNGVCRFELQDFHLRKSDGVRFGDKVVVLKNSSFPNLTRGDLATIPVELPMLSPGKYELWGEGKMRAGWWFHFFADKEFEGPVAEIDIAKLIDITAYEISQYLGDANKTKFEGVIVTLTITTGNDTTGVKSRTQLEHDTVEIASVSNTGSSPEKMNFRANARKATGWKWTSMKTIARQSVSVYFMLHSPELSPSEWQEVVGLLNQQNKDKEFAPSEHRDDK